MEGKSVPRTVRLAGQLESQTFTTVASGGWGAPPPRPPCGVRLVLKSFESHQVGVQPLQSPLRTQPTRTESVRPHEQMFATVASGGWGAHAPQTPHVACARPSISLPRVQCSVGGQRRIHEALLRSLTDIGQEVGLPHLGGTLAAFATCVTRDTLPET